MTERLIERPISPPLDAILGKRFPVLDDGFVAVIDYMGNDDAIVQAARVSYGKGTKSLQEDVGLIRYLMRHRHCYRPDMQVLTAEGWKKWLDCNHTEKFLVPEPGTRSLKIEELPVEIFDAEEDLVTFQNSRMSFAVTPDHRMWFKGKYSEDFQIVRANEMSRWGHFDPLAGYEPQDRDVEFFSLGQLIGFTLGDGNWSGSGVSFHLKKDRKKKFLRQVCSRLAVEITESQSSTHEDGTVFYLSAEDSHRLLANYIEKNARASTKKLSKIPSLDKSPGLARGIFDGLVNSDGHVNENRNNRIEFSSASRVLCEQFQTLAVMRGYDAHFAKQAHGIYRVNAFPEGRTTLESRAEYFSTEFYRGKVFCATTSTGLLIVRGAEDEFGFVCGNTTPFEMCELKLLVRVPMDCWRQWIRHRTANVNEYSTRYSEAIDSLQSTKPDGWRLQSKSNKQGSGEFLNVETGCRLSSEEKDFHDRAAALYRARLSTGVAREQARKDLPLSTYTEAYWKIDLHNLFHFLGLRKDGHAQAEIRAYADEIGKIVAEWCPTAWSAFEDCRLNSMSLTSIESRIAKLVATGALDEALLVAGELRWLQQEKPGKLVRNRERDECAGKLVSLGLAVPWETTWPKN